MKEHTKFFPWKKFTVWLKKHIKTARILKNQHEHVQLANNMD